MQSNGEFVTGFGHSKLEESHPPMAHDGPNFLDPKMKNNLIWEGIEFATLKILYEGCKLQKNENIGATVLNCLCITN